MSLIQYTPVEIKAGMLIIGSLLWDRDQLRVTWRDQLEIDHPIWVPMPICYGRKSGPVRRFETYTMIFSNNLNVPEKNGGAIILPYKNPIKDKDFVGRMLDVSVAEGISAQLRRIFKDWGTVCIRINPFIDDVKKKTIVGLWDNLVSDNRNNLTGNHTQPNLAEYGIAGEQTSINQGLYLNVEMNDLFKTDLKDFDLIIATSNAIKLNDKKDIKYPTIRQIARAIFDGRYYDYILMNRYHGIHTWQDKMILRTLKRKFKINLIHKRKEIYRKYLKF